MSSNEFPGQDNSPDLVFDDGTPVVSQQKEDPSSQQPQVVVEEPTFNTAPPSASATVTSVVEAPEMAPAKERISLAPSHKRSLVTFIIAAAGVALIWWGLTQVPFFAVDAQYWEKVGMEPLLDTYQVVSEEGVVPLNAIIAEHGVDPSTLSPEEQLVAANALGVEVTPLRDVTLTAQAHSAAEQAAGNRPLPIMEALMAALIAALLAAAAILTIANHPYWSAGMALAAIFVILSKVGPPLATFMAVPMFGGAPPLGVVTLTGTTWVTMGLLGLTVSVIMVAMVSIPAALMLAKSTAGESVGGIKAALAAVTQLASSAADEKNSKNK